MGKTQPLPMIAPGTPILVRPANRVHIGADPARSLIIDVGGHVSASGVADLLLALQQPCRADDLAHRVRAAGLSDRDLDEILHQLVTAGRARERRAEPPRTAPAAPSLRVRVHGRGPLTELLTESLAETGIPVRQTVRRPGPGVIASWDTNLVVLNDYLVHDPTVVGTLTRSGIPHLQVRVRDGVGIVGPLVLPGLSSCLRCADHHRTTMEPEWPILAAQLVGRPGQASTTTLRTTAALAHVHIDRLRAALQSGCTPPAPRPQLLDHVLEFRADPTRLDVTHWPAHPLCECRPAARRVPPSSRLNTERML